MALIESTNKPLGRQAPNFNLLWTDGDMYTLKDFVFKKGICIIFTCNHCPYAKAARAPLIELSYMYSSIAYVAINSNDGDAYPDDNYEQMKKYSMMYGIEFPYLHDTQQSVAHAYDAQCTPDIYLFKNEWGAFKLFYHGRINDNRQDPLAVTQKDLQDHCKLLMDDQPPHDVQYPSIGCSIKWKA